MTPLIQNQQSAPSTLGASHLQVLAMLFFAALALPLTAVACPMGMQEHGDICIVPAYSMDDYIQERYEAIESLNDSPYSAKNSRPERHLSPEERREAEARQAQKEKDDKALAEGIWVLSSNATPEGKLCVATFAKFTSQDEGKSGGIVSIVGFQQPKPDAWLIFYGTGLPTPKDVKKTKITLQQDDEPAQTFQVFNYKFAKKIGTIAFAVPGLTAALDGMRDKQSFKLSIDGKSAMTIQWANAAPVIEQLKQCAK